MNFELSPELDKNKVFLIKNTMLEERLDAEYYQPYHYKDLQSLEKSTFKLNKLDDVCSRIVDGPFGSAIKASDYVDYGVPFIRVADITRGEGTIKNDNLIFISEDTHKKISRSKVKPGDVIIAKTGATMGAASVVPQSIPDANIRGDLGALTVITEYCLPHYLMTYINTPIGQRLFWRFDSGGTRGRVVIGNLKKYPILIPPKPIQSQIVAEMDNAYAVKKQKEAEAQRLLDSIDDYLLGELGIELPKQEENTIESRIFTRRLSEVSGGRLDPYYYKPIYENNFIGMFKGKYPIKRLHEIAIDIKNGVEIRNYSDNGFRYLRVTDLGKHSINNNSPRYVDVNSIPPKIKLNTNCILISRSGSLGFVNTVEHIFIDFILSSHIFKVELNNSVILPAYAESFLRCKCGQLEIFRENNGGVIPEINQTALGRLIIPIPPIQKQSEIANHINDIRNRAKKLQQEAKEELEQAKKEVESMILG